ncbi:hypothetical protein PSHT_14028 [Puccinia striiformis]|uniref:Uncharacterized protein n=1 Tax=Puccinia striiformis TaxID=27350 RepID=A0A2S4UMB1_9BASI|nr:hypothetical protein PSHT_14028 [Puccinia striiformis]
MNSPLRSLLASRSSSFSDRAMIQTRLIECGRPNKTFSNRSTFLPLTVLIHITPHPSRWNEIDTANQCGLSNEFITTRPSDDRLYNNCLSQLHQGILNHQAVNLLLGGIRFIPEGIPTNHPNLNENADTDSWLG